MISVVNIEYVCDFDFSFKVLLLICGVSCYFAKSEVVADCGSEGSIDFTIAAVFSLLPR